VKYLSVCSGIEAATAAWHPMGWEPVAFSEIEKFPSAVLAHHYPNVPNWGDMTKFQEWPDATVDVLVGGTPCQSFSVAGLRKGLADPRGNLALTYLAIADRYRPTWLVWENVPGVLSADGGRAFGAILGGMGKLGYGFAYRVLDAQYVRTRRYPGAVPQRRRRVFVVAHLGDWRRAAAVLFDAESLRGNPPPGREAGEEVAAPLVSGAPNGGPAHGARSGTAKETNLVPVAHSLRGEGFDASEGGTGRGTPIVPECANPLTHRMHKGINTTLDEGQTPIPVAYGLDEEQNATREHFGTLKARQNGGGFEGTVATKMAVRRLTPVECERLQGFPEIQKRMVVNVWYSEHQKSDALAETKNRKSQKSALSADENEPPQPARTAEQDSSTSHQSHEPPVLLNVLIDYERGQVQIRNAEKLIWSASIVEKPEKSPPPMPIDDFVQLIASAQCLLEKTPPAGRADSLSHKKHSSARGNGSWCVSVSGDGIEAAVKDAENGTSRQAQSTTSTTSRSGQSSQSCEPNLETLCCSAVAAIAGFIPKTTRRANSYAVSVETVCGFTRIPWRGKEPEDCPDGPRYKALGNSMAVNCMEWLGQRIQMIEEVVNDT